MHFDVNFAGLYVYWMSFKQFLTEREKSNISKCIEEFILFYDNENLTNKCLTDVAN